MHGSLDPCVKSQRNGTSAAICGGRLRGRNSRIAALRGANSRTHLGEAYYPRERQGRKAHARMRFKTLNSARRGGASPRG